MAIYLGMFLVSLSGLMFEIGLTRIFSATIWYHFTFVAISVALLGWGLGGFAVHLLKKRLSLSLEKTALLCLLYAASIPMGLGLILRLPFHYDRLVFYFLVCLGPFLLAGMTLSMAFDLRREIAGRLYFADLLGASAGALGITFLLSWLGGETAVLAVALAPLLAAPCFSRRFLPTACVGAALLLALVGLNERTGLFKIRSAPTKGMYQHLAATPVARVALTGWNAYSRIDAVTGFPPPFLARLYIDSDAWTNVLAWDGRLESVRDLRDWYRALPFRLSPPHPRTLVIGPGGGSDVLVALAAGSAEVTAVEMNPLMLRFVRDFGERAGNLYDQPRVRAVLSEGRTFISRAEEKYDVILLGFVDSWAAVASGGLSLSENHLYTTEAFRAYYDHLTPEGMLVILRWDVDIPRLVSNAVAVLGSEAAGPRIVALLEGAAGGGNPPQMIFMLRRRPFTEEETGEIGSWSTALPIILPGREVREPYAALLSGHETLAQYEAEAPTCVDPVSDDRPFFFAREKPWGVPATMSQGLFGILLLVGLLLLAFVASGKPRGESTRLYSASVVYFSCLGLGFIAIELALLQDLTLLLGHPIFTLSILLFTLLATGGLGAWASGAFPTTPICTAIAVLGLAYAVGLPRIVPGLLSLALPARVLIAVLLVAPLGFAMGMPFPRGLARMGRGPYPAPPFYWGLNGIFSVVGSLLTMLVAVTLGFRVAMAVGCGCYLLAAVAGRALEEKREA